MKIDKASLITLTIFALTACADSSASSTDTSKDKKPAVVKTKKDTLPDIETTDLGNGLYMFKGQGGNIGVLNGSDGLIVIDDQYARMAPKIQTALQAITNTSVRFLINTHYHGDHTGGNVEMHKHGADIIAHDNVYTRLSTPTRNEVWDTTIQPMDKAAWPVITYSQKSTLHLNGQTISLIHTPHAHTDGDSLVYFSPANVLHMGDNFFNGMLPYIDVDGGGSINGMITAHETALAMVDTNTKIIPGHGPLATKSDLEQTYAMLLDIRDLIKARMDAGETIADILANNPVEKYKKYASFINPERMARITFRSLSERP